MLVLADLVTVQPRAQEGGLILRIRDFALPLESAEFRLSSAAYRLNQICIRVAGEILERGFFPVFLSHKEQRQERGKNHHPCGELQLFIRNQGAETIPKHAIADLVVVLRANDE